MLGPERKITSLVVSFACGEGMGRKAASVGRLKTDMVKGEVEGETEVEE
jgi:hypothetical protein